LIDLKLFLKLADDRSELFFKLIIESSSKLAEIHTKNDSVTFDQYVNKLFQERWKLTMKKIFEFEGSSLQMVKSAFFSLNRNLKNCLSIFREVMLANDSLFDLLYLWGQNVSTGIEDETSLTFLNLVD